MVLAMSTISDLLADIESFLREKDMAETTFGRHAVNDGKFVGRLRDGAGVTIATIERVRAFMAGNAAPLPTRVQTSRKGKAKAAA